MVVADQPKPLSRAALRVWAKYFPDMELQTERWLPLTTHLLDSAATMRCLCATWARNDLARLSATQFGSELDGATAGELGRKLAEFLALVHDIGKATPAFSNKVGRLDAFMWEHGLTHGPLGNYDTRKLKHALAGQQIVREWLVARGFKDRQALVLASVVGAHHGIPATRSETTGAVSQTALRGDASWKQVQSELLDVLVDVRGLRETLVALQDVKLDQSYLVYLSGLLIVVDWLASNTDYFPLLPLEDDGERFLDTGVHEPRAAAAEARFELPAFWPPGEVDWAANDLLRQRFDLPEEAQVTATQKEALRVARSMPLPGIMVIQDVMGSGKTEAALLAAEVLAARANLSGVHFALPTLATSDAMFTRMITWLEAIATADPGKAPLSTQLIHGRARLSEEAKALRGRGYMLRERMFGAFPEPENAAKILRRTGSGTKQNASDDLGEPGPAILPWFAGRKKAMLADFVVSTVDHVLFAAMRSPHLALRHLGLLRKVVIVDEVHSYSSYMNTYLERALSWMGAYGIPVILLSATLSHSQTTRFLEAYSQGRDCNRWNKASSDPPVLPAAEIAYPAVIAGGDGPVRVVDTSQGRVGNTVRVELHSDDSQLLPFLKEALRGGGCALVVRNTVRSAQDTFDLLDKEFGDDVVLAHSRFTIADRLAKDTSLVSRFGPPRKGGERPDRAIVVATQVVEQSLDVDFDILLTDLAPIDMLLQRIGRLHRHKRPRPAALLDPRCIVFGVPPVTGGEPILDGGSAAIYTPSVLLKSAAALHEHTLRHPAVVLPGHVRQLIEFVYGQLGSIPEQWEEAATQADLEFWQQVEVARRAAEAFLLAEPQSLKDRHHGLLDWLAGIADDSDPAMRRGRATVRESDESIEVMLVEEKEGDLWTIATQPGIVARRLPTDRVPDREALHTLARSSIRLPGWCAKGHNFEKVLAELESTYFEAWQQEPLLRGQLLLRLKGGATRLAGRTLRYDPDRGLREE